MPFEITDYVSDGVEWRYKDYGTFDFIFIFLSTIPPLYIIKVEMPKIKRKIPEYHKRGSQNATTVLFPNPKNRRTFATSIRNNKLNKRKDIEKWKTQK